MSLRDVASRSGVSFQTVGKVLNGKGTVSTETRERILEAARELGYVPNALARSLVTQSTSTIGIIASDLSDYILARFVVGAEREARGRGHGVLIGSLNEKGSDAGRYLRVLLERRVDGILSAAPQLENDVRIGEMLRGSVPTVSLHHVPGGGVPVVGSDHVRTGFLATRHLLELGHRRIATVRGDEGRRVTFSRLKGYRRALEEAEVAFDPDLVEAGGWEPEGGYGATMRLLERAPDITAIFSQNDTMALGVLSALYDRGMSVPDDCAVVGCDDIPLAAHTIPPLTTVHVPFYDTGETAARLLIDMIDGREKEPAPRTLLPVHLVRRVSCGAGPEK
ncbi:MAG: LacI family DNA-binding transcriptional regulator [Rubrobacteraceae bacterium]